MTVIAFLYNNYYCWSPHKNFRGSWDDVNEAKEHIKGGRYENQNLETYDIETGEWHCFKWRPFFKYKDLEKIDTGNNIELWRWFDDPSDPKTEKHSFEWDGHTRRWGYQGNAMYDSGEWIEE